MIIPLQISGSSEILQLHELLKELEHYNLFIVGAVVLCFVIGTFVFKYYVSRAIEQAKSDVTKKDIKEITEKVEAVKTEFVKEIEHIKISLQFEHSVKTTLFNEKKQAAIGLYEALFSYINQSTDALTNTLKIEVENYDRVAEKLDESFLLLVMAQSKFELYIHDAEISRQVMKCTMDAQGISALARIGIDAMKSKKSDLSHYKHLAEKETDIMYKKQYIEKANAQTVDMLAFYNEFTRRQGLERQKINAQLLKIRDISYAIVANKE